MRSERTLWEKINTMPSVKDIQLSMANDMLSDSGFEDGAELPELPQKDGYFSIYDTVDDLMKNKEAETTLFSLAEAFMLKSGKPIKINKLMIKMVSGMTLASIAEKMSDKVPLGALKKVNNELMKIKK
jgi:hypothetical protein